MRQEAQAVAGRWTVGRFTGGSAGSTAPARRTSGGVGRLRAAAVAGLVSAHCSDWLSCASACDVTGCPRVVGLPRAGGCLAKLSAVGDRRCFAEAARLRVTAQLPPCFDENAPREGICVSEPPRESEVRSSSLSTGSSGFRLRSPERLLHTGSCAGSVGERSGGRCRPVDGRSVADRSVGEYCRCSNDRLTPISSRVARSSCSSSAGRVALASTVGTRATWGSRYGNA